MRALQVPARGGVPEPVGLPEPAPAPRRAPGRARAAALDPLDPAIAAGPSGADVPGPPHVPASEAVGEAVSCTRHAPGPLVVAR